MKAGTSAPQASPVPPRNCRPARPRASSLFDSTNPTCIATHVGAVGRQRATPPSRARFVAGGGAGEGVVARPKGGEGGGPPAWVEKKGREMRGVGGAAAVAEGEQPPAGAEPGRGLPRAF